MNRPLSVCTKDPCVECNDLTALHLILQIMLKDFQGQANRKRNRVSNLPLNKQVRYILHARGHPSTASSSLATPPPSLLTE